MKKNNKTRVITGLTATGDLTLGNYLGAIKNLLKLQEDTNREIFLFVADLHGLTTPIEPKVIYQNVINHLKIYLAAGINPKKVKIFIQSQIWGHTEFAWILTNNIMLGHLSRMTQFKDKTIKHANKTEAISTGLLMYPVLMAADILLYNIDEVIIGKDQTQHLELTRELAKKINRKYNLKFTIPKAVFPEVSSKVTALKEPTKKMSKSDNDKGNTIFLLDEPKLIKQKINNSLTDDENKIYFDPIKKPGISNLIQIYAGIKDISIKETESKLSSLNYKELKETVANTIINLLENLQTKFKKLELKTVFDAIELNKPYIKKEAEKTLNTLNKKVGLII